MNHAESFKIGLSELLANKTKTALTMLGIIFGVASVIAMLSIGEGARQETIEQIELLGTNNIIINQKAPEASSASDMKSFSAGLSLKDVKSITALVPFVESATPQKDGFFNITYKSKQKKLKVIGTTENYPSTYNSKLMAGEFFKRRHCSEYANVCVIGYDVKREFFRFEDPLGKSIKIGDGWYRIIGIISPKIISNAGTEDLGIGNFNKDIYIPLSTMNYKIDFKPENRPPTGVYVYYDDEGQIADVIDRSLINKLTVKVTDDKYIRETAKLIDRVLNRKHYGTDDYEIVVPEEIIAQKQKTQKIFNIVMGAIAGISLLVGGIGIMNIMLANILERTREIGIRRAVGATRLDVLSQFLYEAMIISIIGGMIGIFLGFILTSVITTYAEWRTIITPVSVILAFVVAVATGIGFGSYPAKKAADKDPIESLRYE